VGTLPDDGFVSGWRLLMGRFDRGAARETAGLADILGMALMGSTSRSVEMSMFVDEPCVATSKDSPGSGPHACVIDTTPGRTDGSA